MKTTFLSTKPLCSPGGRPSAPPPSLPKHNTPWYQIFKQTDTLAANQRFVTPQALRRKEGARLMKPNVGFCLFACGELQRSLFAWLVQHSRSMKGTQRLLHSLLFAAGWRAKLFKSSEAVIIESLGSFIQQVASGVSDVSTGAAGVWTGHVCTVTAALFCWPHYVLTYLLLCGWNK